MARAAAAIAWAAALLLAGVAAAAAPAGQAGSRYLLDVPYLPQSEDLCGGAAVAMVLRYWGDQQSHPEDFAPLVDRSAAGIRTDVLTMAVSGRGWNAHPRNTVTGATAEWMRGQIEQRRPVIALIEIAPNRYHYVVVVGWTADRVIAHDPADAPYRVVAVADFERAWAAAGQWALLVLPTEARAAAPPIDAPAAEAAIETGACGQLIQNMVSLARAGDVAAAESGLIAATQLCPAAAAAWRELAGLRFLQSRWAEAAALAERAAAIEPADQAGWDLLATSRYLNHEPDPALRAWNQLSRPTVDLLRMEGLTRTRHPVVAALVDLQPRTVLTPETLGRASRRLDALPSAAATRLRFRPLDGGRVEIEAAVVERPALPRGVAPLVVAAARGALQRELHVEAAAPTRSGELLTAAWRWSPGRPRLAMSLAVPAVSWLPGVTTVDGSWERQDYAAPAIVQLERRHAGLQVADWASSTLRWSTGVGFDRWNDDSAASAGAAIDLRLLDDRVSLAAETAAWLPIGAGHRFATSGVAAAWRSTATRDQPAWFATTSYAMATATAPLGLWPGAGTGHARAPLLRAHPLLDEGVVTGGMFGRQLLHGSIEYQHPLLTKLAGSLQLAIFADAARAWRRLGTDAPSALHVDVGAGLRVALPGKGGTLRVDLARGTRDQRTTVSAGWQAPWPGRMPGPS